MAVYYRAWLYKNPNNCRTSSPFPQPPYFFLHCPLVCLKCQLSFVTVSPIVPVGIKPKD